ncbi:MAG: hypothetical protein KAH77_11280 [Thiomargarita sp.]|nr:hypothetical protein [Thiomargarita sp.]
MKINELLNRYGITINLRKSILHSRLIILDSDKLVISDIYATLQKVRDYIIEGYIIPGHPYKTDIEAFIAMLTSARNIISAGTDKIHVYEPFTQELQRHACVKMLGNASSQAGQIRSKDNEYEAFDALKISLDSDISNVTHMLFDMLSRHRSKVVMNYMLPTKE